ncbi:exonuclease 1 [Selaginella moellendorffii]|uniref:exonuclease 1 n=1 Tax=Selaginella moellendorffii TaxID=88036 RepID=UPI000D1C6787|nr:exonuclease 1 [Selaginella moellendorffii]|eukprot:XP_024537105.1 exonuclease 1 [Selaginella moellendorffii]
MGIQGLLPALKSITTSTNVKEYSGMRVAVDTYSWLHKAAFSCSKDICDGRATASFLNYCMHRVNLLRHHGIKPLLVFDGGSLPMKAEQEEKRSRAREEHLKLARECEASGNHAAAYDHYQKAVDITPEVAHQLILVLRRENVEYIVSPYEADAQMAFLALRGVVDAVITEDSDLVAYGCPKILFKMDKNGQGFELQYADLVKNRDLNLTSFTKRMMLEMCILSGCDYLPSLQGMGVKRAHNLIRRFRSYEKVIRHLKFSGVMIPKSYEEGFRKALLTFCHHLVYDPTQDELVHLTELPADCSEEVEFLGPKLSRSLVQQIVRGVIHPETHAPLQLAEPPQSLCEDRKPIAKQKEQKRLNLPAQRNVLTNYFISKSEASTQQFKAPRASDSPEKAEMESESLVGRASCLSPRTPNSSPDRHHVVRFTSNEVQCSLKIEEDTKIPHGNKRICLEYEEESSNDSDCDMSQEQSAQVYSMQQRRFVARGNYVVSRPSNVNDENAMRQGIKKVRKAGTSKPCSKAMRGKKRSPPAEASLPKFSSSLLGVNMEKTATLSANVDHTQRYSAIAQESIEKFVQTISAFAHGARVSGLRRPPLKSNLTNINREEDGLFNKGLVANLWQL